MRVVGTVAVMSMLTTFTAVDLVAGQACANADFGWSESHPLAIGDAPIGRQALIDQLVCKDGSIPIVWRRRNKTRRVVDSQIERAFAISNAGNGYRRQAWGVRCSGAARQLQTSTAPPSAAPCPIAGLRWRDRAAHLELLQLRGTSGYLSIPRQATGTIDEALLRARLNGAYAAFWTGAIGWIQLCREAQALHVAHPQTFVSQITLALAVAKHIAWRTPTARTGVCRIPAQPPIRTVHHHTAPRASEVNERFVALTTRDMRQLDAMGSIMRPARIGRDDIRHRRGRAVAHALGRRFAPYLPPTVNLDAACFEQLRQAAHAGERRVVTPVVVELLGDSGSCRVTRWTYYRIVRWCLGNPNEAIKGIAANLKALKQLLPVNWADHSVRGSVFAWSMLRAAAAADQARIQHPEMTNAGVAAWCAHSHGRLGYGIIAGLRAANELRSRNPPPVWATRYADELAHTVAAVGPFLGGSHSIRAYDYKSPVAARLVNLLLVVAEEVRAARTHVPPKLVPLPSRSELYSLDVPLLRR